MPDNLPARRTSASRFPERQENRPVYARITDQPPPRTEYVYVQDKQGGEQGRWSLRWRPGPPRHASTPAGIPAWLGNERLVGYAWIMSMIIVSFDEWHNNNILPRPARLWYTSLVYGMLALVGMVDVTIPLVNALAIGYTITLLWQYYNKTGQFAQ